MLPNERQANARAFDFIPRFKSLECFPYLLVKFWGDTGSIITNTEFIEFVFFPHVDPNIRIFPARMPDRVTDEVH